MVSFASRAAATRAQGHHASSVAGGVNDRSSAEIGKGGSSGQFKPSQSGRGDLGQNVLAIADVSGP